MAGNGTPQENCAMLKNGEGVIFLRLLANGNPRFREVRADEKFKGGSHEQRK